MFNQMLFFILGMMRIVYNYLLGDKDFEEVRIDNNGKLIDGWFKYNVDETIVLDDVTHGYYFLQCIRKN